MAPNHRITTKMEDLINQVNSLQVIFSQIQIKQGDVWCGLNVSSSQGKRGVYIDLEAPTGCTVNLCREGAVGAVDVRDSVLGTRKTDLFRLM